MGCGGKSRLVLDIDFLNREPLEFLKGTPLAGLSVPRVTSASLENAEFCDEQSGTVTNLDPTLLVPADFLHRDEVFPWMYASKQFVDWDKEQHAPPDAVGQKVFDIIDQLGITRCQGDALRAFLKARELSLRGHEDLAKQQLETVQKFTGTQVRDIVGAATVVALSFSGLPNNLETRDLLIEAKELADSSPEQYGQLRRWTTEPQYRDIAKRHVEVMSEYARGYSQFCQTWLYSAKGIEPDQEFQASTRDLRTVGMFYGTAFEHLSSGFALPAALNNIRNGRPFDQFERMNMRKYLCIDKAGRSKCFESNARLSVLAEEFDSSIRNASHHGGFRLHHGTPAIIEYRTSDSTRWKSMRYVDYLIKCNRIFIGMMRLFLLHIFVTRTVE